MSHVYVRALALGCVYGHISTVQTGSFACLFGCSPLARPLRLGSQRAGSPCSVVVRPVATLGARRVPKRYRNGIVKICKTRLEVHLANTF